MKNKNYENKGMGWKFDNSYIYLPDKFYYKQKPVSVKSPRLIILNKSLAESLGLDYNALESENAIEIFAGNAIPKGAQPIAQAYAGHQFGHFTMLGDGRAVLLGEHITPKGERFDIQLKGSGRTPFSRGGDGRASLGPMLREYIISEALFNLGIPTTRSLAVVTTGEDVIRESVLPGAILTRVAASHIRVGTFQYISVYGSKEDLKSLADYTLQRHYPDIASDEYRYLKLIREVIKRQAELISKWQLVGFIHGVMNTDNMTISGESIDFGPCAFMDIYNKSTVFSSIDRGGRYAYGNQPYIASWNLTRLSETLLPLIHDDEDKAVEMVNKEMSSFSGLYNEFWFEGMKRKLGLFNDEMEDNGLITDLLDIMEKYNADYTNTFRGLTIGELCGMELFDTNEFSLWKNNWEMRLNKQNESKEEVKELMMASNPAIIPRNHRVEEALGAAVDKGDLSIMESLLKALQNPYGYTEDQVEYSKAPALSGTHYKTFCGT